jgi:hypothetical protein
MIVKPIVNAVAASIAAAIALEQLQRRRRFQRLRQPGNALVDDERPSRMVGNKAVISKYVSAGLALTRLGLKQWGAMEL